MAETSRKDGRDRRNMLRRAAVCLRYLLPLGTGIVLFVLDCFHSVTAVQAGVRLLISPLRLCFSTVSGTRDYFTGTPTAAGNRLYAPLLAAALCAIFFYLLAAALHLFAALSAFAAFRRGQSPEAVRRAKIRFKVVFPNRVCLFLSDCLWLLPALFPLAFSLIDTRLAPVGGGATLYLLRDPPLVVVGVLTLATLALALGIARTERWMHMNLFLIDPPDEPPTDAEPTTPPAVAASSDDAADTPPEADFSSDAEPNTPPEADPPQDGETR